MNKNRKKELGQGLRALLSNIENTEDTQGKKEIVKELSSNILTIPLDSIEENPFQPRKEFDPVELEELAKSIKVHGLIQGITVRSLGGNKFQLISGERRLRASKLAGLDEVPAFIRTANDQEMLEMALIENIQRSDLNALEVAISYQRLMDECKLTHELLSERVGKNRSTVTNYVRLLKLPPDIQHAIKSGKITMGHARSLAGITDVALQLDVFKRLIEKEMSVRDLENYIRSLSSQKAQVPVMDPADEDPEVRKITKELSNLLGRKIKIQRSEKGAGKLIIPFDNDDEFNYIYDIISGNK
jgi:ParB family transcriptional regulator, chromosome partitioning protein